MLIESRLTEGHRIRCAAGHVFIVRTLGPSVECPKCGETALSTDLATAYFPRPSGHAVIRTTDRLTRRARTAADMIA